MRLLLLLVLEIIVPVVLGAVTLSESDREASLACPGEIVKYFCTSSVLVSSITWGFICATPATYTVGRSADGGVMTLPCNFGGGETVTFNLSLTYASSDITQSNMSLLVVDAKYSIRRLKEIGIYCDDVTSSRYLNLSGPPSSPHNLSYNFGTTRNDTHLPITFSWFLPLSESRDNHAAEGLVLSYTPISETADEKLELSNEITNVTVFLPYNVTYDVIFYSISCGGNLKSDNISISITLPGYKNISIFHPGYERSQSSTIINWPVTTTLSPAIPSGSSQAPSTVIVIIVSAFAIVIMLLVIIIVVLICVIKFRAAKTKRPPDGGCTENSEGIDSTNTKMSMNECNVSMDSNLAYGIRGDMVSSTHFTPAQQRQDSGGQNIPGNPPSHGYEGSESPEHAYATVMEELNITHTFQTGEDYDDVIP